jgi:hypothetical protein
VAAGEDTSAAGTAGELLQLKWHLEKIHQVQEQLGSSSSYIGSWRSYRSSAA